MKRMTTPRMPQNVAIALRQRQRLPVILMSALGALALVAAYVVALLPRLSAGQGAAATAVLFAALQYLVDFGLLRLEDWLDPKRAGAAGAYFSIPATIGLIVGTYSSIWVATAIVLRLGVKRDWGSKSDSKAGTQFGNIKA